MAKGNSIIVSSPPRGVFKEGIVSGTPKPGTLMQIQAGTSPVGGVFTYEAYAPGTDGEQRPVMVLLEDDLQGKTATDAYVDGTRCRLYCPIMGEELNMLVADVAGTGTTGSEAKAIGDLLIGDTGTGKLIDTIGTPESEPFQLLEAQAEPISADALLWCLYTGY